MSLSHKPGHAWSDAYRRCVETAPEAFHDDRVLNLRQGRWHRDGVPLPSTSPVDGTPIAGPPFIGPDEATDAVAGAVDQHHEWCHVPLRERKARVSAALDEMEEHRELLTLLLVWEIGKPWRLAAADVDRGISGVRWYVDQIDAMLANRDPLDGPVVNVASWNYPMSVIAHAMLVQVLAGNATVVKVPTDGGLACLTLAVSLCARSGLPVTLISGSGAQLGPALVTSPLIGCVSFVGGREAGDQVGRLVSSNTRYMLEQDGLNCWGVWEFTDWDGLAGHLRKGFEYGKQRCTAYPRYVVQRSLFDRFLATYLPVMREVTFGHPLAVESPDDPLPNLDFGPLISAAKVKELEGTIAEAVERGGIPLYAGSREDGRFIAGQDDSCYLPPTAILSPPTSSQLYHAEPFGPVDTIVVVDTEAELLAEMNASNGALVASLACDDEDDATRIAGQLQAFKIGVNRPRSRGDRTEVFGGRGSSWRGAFVGGELLVKAVTQGPDDAVLPGNFAEYSRFPS